MRSPRTSSTKSSTSYNKRKIQIKRRLYLNGYNMKSQNLKRRNSEYALFESQRELETLKWHLLEANQIKLNEREYIRVADWRWRNIFIKKATKEVAEKLKNWKDATMRKEITKNSEEWKDLLRSIMRNHEQWVYSCTILTYWAVLTYLRSSSSSCYLEFEKAEPRSWSAAKRHERIWVFLETFLIVNMLNEI